MQVLGSGISISEQAVGSSTKIIRNESCSDDLCFLENGPSLKIDKLSAMKLLLEVQINNQTSSFPITADLVTAQTQRRVFRES